MGNFDHTVKIIFLGDFSVNKKELLRALRDLPARPEVKCLNPGNGMLEMLFLRNGKRVRVKISETGGQERFRSITSSFYRGVHGCLLLFDVTNKSTFDSLNNWQEELCTNTLTDEVVVMLGGCTSNSNGAGAGTGTTGTGSGHASGSGSGSAQVPRRTAEEFAKFLNVPYRELSAGDPASLVSALEEMVDQILLKASRLPHLSYTITPLDQRLHEEEAARGGTGSGRRKSTCVC
ncbi:ras-related protein Rab-18-B-like [Babylonia areolata]|uniref:ras-related protein Rab-18-B-like n=1 Tax=Babylonia areolata TaxID=304850 RepID=UPI003FD68832